MYRTTDPRFRRRLDELGATLETANIEAQNSLYQFHQNYLRPCFSSIKINGISCIEASCPMLNLTASQRARHRQQQQQGRRQRGRAELNFDFYDDWDEEDDALMGWGNDEFDRLLGDGGAGYGSIATQPPPRRERAMSYPKARRKSAVDIEPDPTVIPGSSLLGKLFGGKLLRYKPSAADLQDNPTRPRVTEGEALLSEGGTGKRHRRVRSATATSGHTTDSQSSRGDIFPSDEEDAIPLDDEFAMVLERRATLSIGPGVSEESDSTHTRSTGHQRGKNAATRQSRSSTNSSARTGDAAELQDDELEEAVEPPALNELKREENELAEEEEGEVERKRSEAQKLAANRGLLDHDSKEATPERIPTPVLEPVDRTDEPSALTTPLAGTDDEAEMKDGKR